MNKTLSHKALQLKREYARQYNKKYRANNREKIKQYSRKWRSENKDKVRLYNIRYWEKKAIETDNLFVTDNLIVTDNTGNNKTYVTCLNCNVGFLAKRNDARFCGSRCRVSYNRKKSIMSLPG